ncbi:MAG: hypothetical protein K2M15_04250 [Oscillospiraceae bacterium]|nr:hypothetical protein [Oscillospiraceae bacterium]MDE7170853.1 hypothetical protein [Oscillospiraceae bacterium]
MDENKSPQDFLNEIFEKSQAAAPPMPPPRFEPPEDVPSPAPPSDEPTEKRGAEEGARPFPWLGVVLGAALLVMGVCLLQLVRMNHRLDELQEAVDAVQIVDDLRAENGRLQVQLDQTERNAEHLRQSLDDSRTELAVQTAQKKRLDYLWYIGQFMEHGDYPMAALAATLSAQAYFPDSFTAESLAVYLNLEQISQYRVYCHELADKGYLKLTLSAPYQSTFTVPTFPEQWDPEQNPDMAALGILWCALDEYYVTGDPGAAAQYLLNYQWYALYSRGEGETDGPRYPQRILDTASDYTIEQYERLIHDLTESGWLTETDGILYYREDQLIPDVLYNLPFDPPGGYLYGEIPIHD